MKMVQVHAKCAFDTADAQSVPRGGLNVIFRTKIVLHHSRCDLPST